MPLNPSVTDLTIVGLFGHLKHKVTFREDDPTILTGLNGSGKTHVLHALQGLARADVAVMDAIPFTYATLTYKDGAKVSATRISQLGSGRIDFCYTDSTGRAHDPILIHLPDDEDIDDSLPPWISRVAGRYRDDRTGDVVPASAIRSLAARRGSLLRGDDEIALAKFKELLPKFPTLVIDTRRLDVSRHEDDSIWRAGRGANARTAGSRIEVYLNRIGLQMDRARRDAVRTSQEADISFAERALASASKTVNESKLRSRYNAVVAQYNDLARNGLTVGDAPIPFPGKTTPTVRRILDPFVEDWEKRLAPLLPLNEKIQLFRTLLDDKLESSFKRTAAHAKGIVITDLHGRQLDVNRLSSGEQHLLALYTRLLFDTRRGSLVLIDEPEISLHPAWQHSFIRDIDRVKKLVPMQVVIATHSPAVVNERWDLEEALQITEPPGPDDGEESQRDLDHLGVEDEGDE